MTTSNQTVIQTYSGNGSTTSFAITPNIVDDTEIAVVLRSPGGLELAQVLVSDYNLTGGNVLTGAPSTTVVMVTAPASGWKLIIKRETPLVQLTEFFGNGPLDAETIEAALDKNVGVMQELNYKVRRALKFNETSTSLLDINIPDPSAGMVFAWNAAGTAIEYVPMITAVGSISAALVTERSTVRTLTNVTLSSPSGLVKADIGLSNVDNTADATKYTTYDTAVRTLTNKTLTSPVINSPTGITKTNVGLSNVDNTSDATRLQVYRTILQVEGSHIAGKVAGTYAIPQAGALAVSGTGTLYTQGLVHIRSTDYPTISSLTAHCKVECILAVNDVAPTGNFTVGLYPVTRPGTSGGAGLNIYTLGTVIAGSTCGWGTPAADLLDYQVTGSTFALPSDGFYCIGVVTTATVAASSHLHFYAKLRVRYE